MVKSAKPQPIFPWNDSLKIGIEKIDEQHIHLVNLINELFDALINRKINHTTRDNIFNRLIEYTSYHFATEEEIWKDSLTETNCLMQHREAHVNFVKELKEIYASANEFSNLLFLEKIAHFMLSWLIHHILESDKFMAEITNLTRKRVPHDDSIRNAKGNLPNVKHALVDGFMNLFKKYSKVHQIYKRETRANRQLQRSLEDAKAIAENSVNVKNALLAYILHEIKTPVATIDLAQSLMKRSNKTTSKISKQINIIEESCTYLKDFSNKFRDITNINSLSHLLANNRFNIKQVVRKTVNLTSPFCKPKVKIRIHFKTDQDYYIGDALIIQQGLLNLLTNSIKNVDSGFIKICVTYDDESELMSIEVSDSGHGISADCKDLLFVPFAPTPKTDYHHLISSGLGLSITKGLATIMGGDVRISSELDRGSCFTFSTRVQKSLIKPRNLASTNCNLQKESSPFSNSHTATSF